MLKVFTLLHHAVDIEADGAAQSGYITKPTISAWFLGLGADPHLPNNNGETPVSLAQRYGYSEFLSLIGEDGLSNDR